MSILRPTPSIGNPAPVAIVIVGSVPAVKTLSDAEFRAFQHDLAADLADEPRPTWTGDAYDPTPEDESAYLEMVATDDERDSLMLETFLAMHDETLEDCYANFDLMNPNEIIEARGFHPSVCGYEV